MKVIEITDKELDNVVKENKKVLVDCYATWCGPCKMLAPVIDEVAEECEDVVFVKMDVDNNDEVSSKYNVVSIPTLLVFENGELKDRSLGFIPKDEVLALIK